ncbi:MAG: hypothetical protein U0W24_18610 [Bacteroidales bacterium]
MKNQNDDIGVFELVIKNNDDSLTIDNYDISELKNVLYDLEVLIRKPLLKDQKKANITLKYEDGSVKLRLFTIVAAINSVISDLNIATNTNSIFEINQDRAKIIDEWQKNAKTNNVTYLFKDSNQVEILKIDSSTNYFLQKQTWVEVEVIFYGEITDLGGKTKPNIHLDTSAGTITIDCDRNDLINQNRLYKRCGVKVKAKQDLFSYEYLNDSMKFIEFIDYSGTLEGEELLKFIENGTEAWKNIPDSVKWKRNLRDDED